jgi:hypothetical protein
MCRVSKENKKAEAIKRMKVLNIFPQTIQQFKRSNLVSYSEPPMGANYWLDDEQVKLVKEFEEKHNALVYFVIRSYAEFGKLDSFLYVSDHEEEWELDHEDIADGYALAYVYNYDIPEYSEFGSIAVQNRFGGLVRVG